MSYINITSLFKTPYDFVPINLNQLFIQNKHLIPSVKDPYYINEVLRNLRMFTYGGYGENRKDVWNGTYLDETNGYFHLGVDINVYKNTPVFSPMDTKVIDVFTDTDTKIGWGGRVILQNEKNKPFIIMGHLDPISINVKKGQHLNTGELIGKVGTWPTNGNTFEHLHLQLRMTSDFDTMDGYGTESDLLNNPCPFTTKI
jgi:hypothetical protein